VTRLPCCRRASILTGTALLVLAPNPADFSMRFTLPEEMSAWSLSGIRFKPVKIGPRSFTLNCAPSYNMHRRRYRKRLSPCSGSRQFWNWTLLPRQNKESEGIGFTW